MCYNALNCDDTVVRLTTVPLFYATVYRFCSGHSKNVYDDDEMFYLNCSSKFFISSFMSHHVLFKFSVARCTFNEKSS